MAQHDTQHEGPTSEERALTESLAPPAPTSTQSWVTPDFVEISTCAEIGAYVFTA